MGQATKRWVKVTASLWPRREPTIGSVGRLSRPVAASLGACRATMLVASAQELKAKLQLKGKRRPHKMVKTEGGCIGMYSVSAV